MLLEVQSISAGVVWSKEEGLVVFRLIYPVLQVYILFVLGAIKLHVASNAFYYRCCLAPYELSRYAKLFGGHVKVHVASSLRAASKRPSHTRRRGFISKASRRNHHIAYVSY